MKKQILKYAGKAIKNTVMSSPNKERSKHADSIIRNHMIWSMGMSVVIPLPVADVLAVSAVQLDMIRQLCKVYEKDFSDTSGKAIVTALTSSTLAKAGARSVIKLIPGIGTIIGGVAVSILNGASTYALGEVFNISGESIDVNRYIALLADIVGREPEVVYVPDELLAELNAPGSVPAYGHLFKVRHHAMLSSRKAEERIGFAPHYDVASGHRHTFEWFTAKGWDQLDGPLADPVWKASWDFDAEAAVAGRIRNG